MAAGDGGADHAGVAGHGLEEVLVPTTCRHFDSDAALYESAFMMAELGSLAAKLWQPVLP